MRVVLAPDSFKGTVTAEGVAEALAAGWRSVRPHDRIVRMPMADGGEGTLDAIAAASPGARRLPVRVPGPVGAPVDAAVLLLPGGTAVVELAATSGLPLLAVPRPRSAHTRGFGVAIRAALAAGATDLLLTIGGSASTDGGAGALRELGARFLDAAGEDDHRYRGRLFWPAPFRDELLARLLRLNEERATAESVTGTMAGRGR